ncbi:unnamed protein product [Rhizophagus irregularis]|nr:unnamed protein product [Rhizophagus irregularis]
MRGNFGSRSPPPFGASPPAFGFRAWIGRWFFFGLILNRRVSIIELAGFPPLGTLLDGRVPPPLGTLLDGRVSINELGISPFGLYWIGFPFGFYQIGFSTDFYQVR